MEQAPAGRLRRPPGAAALFSAAKSAVRDPVVVILVLAAIFDGISGNPIHSMLLLAAASALAWDQAPLRQARRAGEAELDGTAPGRALERVRGRLDHGPALVLLAAALAYAVVVGGFARYSWPATVAILVPGAAAIAVAWRGPLPSAPRAEALDPAGTVAWVSVFLTVALWELTNLLLQPTLTTDSQAHPTLSVLSDPILSTHPGRTVGLVAWLGLGRFLARR